MHNISKEQIKDLANQLAQATTSDSYEDLLIKARELYEKVTILHYQSVSKNATEELENEVKALLENEQIIEEPQETELSVQERIQQIMDTAPEFTPKIEKPVREEPVEIATEITKDIEKTTIDELVESKESQTTISLEEELKDAISADYAANLFENAEKIETTKKSLNDKLSQAQLQIGLNDRIAFVKHLFNGSQADFNRVLSQLNSFHSESQAKHFINNIVKPDYNWDDEIEYEERFMNLIERKFL